MNFETMKIIEDESNLNWESAKINFDPICSFSEQAMYKSLFV